MWATPPQAGGTPSAGDQPPRRGEVRLIDLEPTRGSEANKRRPGIIVSNDRANATADRLGRGVVTVVPVTSNIVRVFPFQVPLAGTGWHERSCNNASPIA
ncbi:MAG: type II toxin-antitoxin system PemK/MazF family toxin [Dermatophilaceae bacterium]